VRSQIEIFLEELGHFAFRRAWAILLIAAAVLILLASQIHKIEVRTSIDEFLESNDPTRIVYDGFLTQFGRDDVILIAVEPPEVFDFTFLERLSDFHDALEEEVPHLREVQSLISARETRGEGDQLVVGELFEEWPADEDELAEIRARALANPLYVDLFLSRDARLTTVSVEIEAFAEAGDEDDAFSGFEDTAIDDLPASPDGLSSAQEEEAVAVVNAIVARFQAPDFRLYAGGMPVLNTALMTSMLTDMVRFTALSTLMIACLLSVVFRRALGVAIPLAVALLSLLATLGTMGMIGVPAMPISEIVPSFLLSIGVGASVHLIAIFLQRLDRGDSREEAISGALAHSGLPILMTSLTTAGGLASFAVADLVPVAIFGVVAPLGILLSLALSLFLTPALLAITPMAQPTPTRGTPTRVPLSIRLLTRAGDFAVENAGLVLGVCAALLALAIAGMFRLHMSFDNLDWFPEDLPAKVAVHKLDAEFGGSMALELLIDTGEVDGLHEPSVLDAVDRARAAIDGMRVGEVVVGKTVSLVDILKEIHQALNEGRPEARVVPDDRMLVSQELILFENSGSDDLEDFVDSEFRIGRFTLRIPMVDALHYPRFGEEVTRVFRESLPTGTEVQLTGAMMVMGRTFTASIETIFKSYGIALVVITPLMILLLGSARLGLIAMIPNLFPIILTLGLMGWTDQPLEMFSLLIGSVALGLAVDDTIHFMHGFRRSFQQSGDVQTAVRETLQTTGQALLFTSIVLSLGFLIYVFSDLSVLTRFGVLTSFSIVMAFLSDILLAPALMQVTARFSSLRPAEPRPSSSGT